MSTEDNEQLASADNPNSAENVVPASPSFIVELARAARKCSRQERKWVRTMLEKELEPYQAGDFLKYSRHTIWKFLRRERVNHYRDLIARQLEQDLSITRHWVLSRYKKIANSSLQRLFKQGTTEFLMPHEWSSDDAPAVQEYSFDSNGNPKIKLHDTVRALDALAKYTRLFGPERVEITGKDGKPIEHSTRVMDALNKTEDPNVAAELYSELIKGPKKD